MNKLPFHLVLFLFLLAGCRSSILEDPSTTVSYTIARPSHIKLTVENSYNTVVATLVDADQSAGRHMASFNVSGLQEGIYFYTLESRPLDTNEPVTTTRKMLLLKR